MKKLIIIALAVAALCVLMAGLSFAGEEDKAEVKQEKAKKVEVPAGQQVFLDAKCQMCHTVLDRGIGEPPAKDAEKKDGPPDLSLTGAGRTAEQMSLFLKKEGALDEKNHMMKFAGSDEDLSTLVGWLLTLKPAEEEKKSEKAAKVEKAEKAEKAEGCGHDHSDHEKTEKAEKADGCGHDHGHADHDEDAHEGHDTDAEGQKGE
jgi:mono/diheme cytochrome c family protein